MKEQFDRKLVEKIKSSFENYEEPFHPKEWEKFSSAYFKKDKSKPLWAWVTLITGIAASLIIGVLVWPGIVDSSRDEYVSHDRELAQPLQERKDTAPPSIESELEEEDAIEKTVVPARKPTTSPAQIEEGYVSIPPITSPRMRDLNEKMQNIQISGQALGEFQPLPHKELELAQVREREIAKSTGELVYDIQKSPLVPVNFLPLKKPEPLTERNLALGGVIPKEGEQQTEGVQPKTIPPAAPLKEEDAQKIINNWAMADMPSVMDTRKSEAGVKWGLVMAPQAASNTTMGVNLGGGVMSEISLSRRLKLDVGVTFARQSLVPVQGQNVAMAMSSSLGRTTADQLQNASAFSQSRSAAVLGANMVMPASPTYELNFANLDIPINLKYKVMDKPQSGLYLISGLSSMIYLSQSTSETFNISYMGINQANAFSAGQVQTLTTEITPQEGENTVDLGRMLNLSFGYEYKLSGGTFLSVEPFYKLPIGNMTFVDQQFSIGGVNLRMNFQFKK